MSEEEVHKNWSQICVNFPDVRTKEQLEVFMDEVVMGSRMNTRKYGPSRWLILPNYMDN